MYAFLFVNPDFVISLHMLQCILSYKHLIFVVTVLCIGIKYCEMIHFANKLHLFWVYNLLYFKEKYA